MKRRTNLPRGLVLRNYFAATLAKGFLLLLPAFSVFPATSWCVPANPAPFETSQPDGKKIKLSLKGDEFYHWHEDGKGYTVLKDKTAGDWVYAEKDAGDVLKAGKYKVGVHDPEQLKLPKGLIDAGKAALARKRRTARDSSQAYRVSGASTVSGLNPSSAPSRAPILTGTMKNLVILARFSDQSASYTQAQFDSLFNQVGYTADGALGSVKDYFLQVSYNQLTVQSVVTAWVALPNTQAYYGANDGFGNDLRPRQMAADAINALEAGGFDFTTVDGNGDGQVDGLTILHSGVGEETTGNPANAIWSHKWNLITPITYDGVTMNAYHTEPELRLAGPGITRIGVICHETGHFLGLPDLYDTAPPDSNGIGNFCIMAGGAWNGPGSSGSSPAHMSAWCKKTLGWATATQLTTVGTRPLPRIEDNSAALYLLRDSSFPPEEYFLIENRQGYGFDAYLPGTERGMLIWHVDETMPDNDNAARYLVDLEEAVGGQHLQAAAWAAGDDYDYFRTGNKTDFSDITTPNNRSYSELPLKLPISGVSATGNVMTFYLGTTDTTPPVAVATVNDGLGTDIAKTGSLTQLSGSWTASSDPETGISGYRYAIGTAAGLVDVAGWTDNGALLSVTRGGLSLTDGATYYFGVKAVSGVGVESVAAWSNGQQMDIGSPSDVPYVYDGTGADIDYISSPATLSANWGVSPSGGITQYEYAIGTTPGGIETLGWTSTGLNTYITKPSLALAEGTTYYFAIKAKNSLGFYSSAAASDGQRVDLSSPSARIIVNSALPARVGAFSAKLIVTEANGLASGPQLYFKTSNGTSAPLTLSYLAYSTWTASGYLESYHSTGTATFHFSAADPAGNTGAVITSGGSFAVNPSLSGGAGGAIANSDGNSVTVPDGAYTGTLFITISTVPAGTVAGADAASPDSKKIFASDRAREFSARDAAGNPVTVFLSPLTITLSYPDADSDGRIDMDLLKESTAWIYYLDPSAGRWTPLPGVTRNTAANILSAGVSHFSVYSVRAAGSSAVDIASLRAYPNPCDFGAVPFLTIDGIPADAAGTRVYIYNAAGELVRSLAPGDGINELNAASWDGRLKGGVRAASGLYIYLVKTSNYGKGSGKFFIVW